MKLIRSLSRNFLLQEKKGFNVNIYVFGRKIQEPCAKICSESGKALMICLDIIDLYLDLKGPKSKFFVWVS